MFTKCCNFRVGFLVDFEAATCQQHSNLGFGVMFAFFSKQHSKRNKNLGYITENNLTTLRLIIHEITNLRGCSRTMGPYLPSNSTGRGCATLHVRRGHCSDTRPFLGMFQTPPEPLQNSSDVTETCPVGFAGLGMVVLLLLQHANMFATFTIFA